MVQVTTRHEREWCGRTATRARTGEKTVLTTQPDSAPPEPTTTLSDAIAAQCLAHSVVCDGLGRSRRACEFPPGWCGVAGRAAVTVQRRSKIRRPATQQPVCLPRFNQESRGVHLAPRDGQRVGQAVAHSSSPSVRLVALQEPIAFFAMADDGWETVGAPKPTIQRGRGRGRGGGSSRGRGGGGGGGGGPAWEDNAPTAAGDAPAPSPASDAPAPREGHREGGRGRGRGRGRGGGGGGRSTHPAATGEFHCVGGEGGMVQFDKRQTS